MNWLAVTAGILMILACGGSGSLYLLYRARRIRLHEGTYGIATPYLQYIAGGIGVVTGLVVGGLIAYFLSLNQKANLVEWIGRFSYVLIAAASGGHILTLVVTGFHLWREQGAWDGRVGPGSGTLGGRRIQALRRLKRQHKHYADLKERDEVVLEELVDVIGRPLLLLRRNLVRLPFYGYLGTVCGILIMAEELGQIGEASEAFEVLRSMARGLVLAFNTTLVGLLTYLPLRKISDVMLQRISDLEVAWVKFRDEQEGLKA